MADNGNTALPRGFIITDAGRALIAGWSAGTLAKSLQFAEVMAGKGAAPPGTTLQDLHGITDLFSPNVRGTSTEPYYDGDTVYMTVQFRSDTGAGGSGLDPIEEGYWLSEFGVFVSDPGGGGGRILFCYGTLGSYPQHVAAFDGNGADVRDFPLSITIGEGIYVSCNYNPGAFLTSASLNDAVQTTILPQVIELINNAIKSGGYVKTDSSTKGASLIVKDGKQLTLVVPNA